MGLEIVEGDGGGAEVEIGAPMALAHEHPAEFFKRPEFVVAKIGGDVGVGGDDERDLEDLTVVDATDAEEGGFEDVDDVGSKVDEAVAHGAAREGQAEFGIEGKADGREGDDFRAEEFLWAAGGGEDEDFVASAAQTFRGLDKHGDDAVDLGEKRLRHQGDSHSYSSSVRALGAGLAG